MHRTLRTLLAGVDHDRPDDGMHCSSDTTGANASASQLGSAVSRSLSASPDAVTVGGHTLSLTAVTITVTRAELKPSDELHRVWRDSGR
jgi:hypothetical protein